MGSGGSENRESPSTLVSPVLTIPVRLRILLSRGALVPNFCCRDPECEGTIPEKHGRGMEFKNAISGLGVMSTGTVCY